jgi:hypothetical protein
VGDGEEEEAELAEEEDIADKIYAGAPEQVGLRGEVVTDKIVPQSFHPRVLRANGTSKVLVFGGAETPGK